MVRQVVSIWILTKVDLSWLLLLLKRGQLSFSNIKMSGLARDKESPDSCYTKSRIISILVLWLTLDECILPHRWKSKKTSFTLNCFLNQVKLGKNENLSGQREKLRERILTLRNESNKALFMHEWHAKEFFLRGEKNEIKDQDEQRRSYARIHKQKTTLQV